MIKKTTVLVLGAGASNEYDFPLDVELRDRIVNDLLGNSPQRTKLIEMGYTNEIIDEFRNRLHYSQAPTIDSFLAWQKREVIIEIGKIAIAQLLLQIEREGRLFNPYDHWYKHLINKMNASCENFNQNNLSVITFNYDRSLDFFINKVLYYKYDITESECKKMTEMVPIIHPYGKLGSLPFEDKNGIPYGTQEPTIEQLKLASKGIRIVSEVQNRDDPEFVKARRLLKNAERIYFIGFGYNQENMDQLNISSSRKGATIIGTAFHMSSTEKGRVVTYFRTKARNIKLKDINANDFIKSIPLDE